MVDSTDAGDRTASSFSRPANLTGPIIHLPKPIRLLQIGCCAAESRSPPPQGLWQRWVINWHAQGEDISSVPVSESGRCHAPRNVAFASSRLSVTRRLGRATVRAGRSGSAAITRGRAARRPCGPGSPPRPITPQPPRSPTGRAMRGQLVSEFAAKCRETELQPISHRGQCGARRHLQGPNHSPEPAQTHAYC
jgi:hypothetical protein